MKSKISCWRLVRSMECGLRGGAGCAMKRTRVREGSAGRGRNANRGPRVRKTGARAARRCVTLDADARGPAHTRRPDAVRLLVRGAPAHARARPAADPAHAAPHRLLR